MRACLSAAEIRTCAVVNAVYDTFHSDTLYLNSCFAVVLQRMKPPLFLVLLLQVRA